jgi:hypothetical protein
MNSYISSINKENWKFDIYFGMDKNRRANVL